MPELFPEVIFLEDKSALDELPQKFQNITATEKIFSRDIKYSDIDLNEHVNNAKYIELLDDCYDNKFHSLHHMKRLTTLFLSETKFGDKIQISKGTRSEKEFIEAKNLSSDKIVFQAQAEWEQLKWLKDEQSRNNKNKKYGGYSKIRIRLSYKSKTPRF